MVLERSFGGDEDVGSDLRVMMPTWTQQSMVIQFFLKLMSKNKIRSVLGVNIVEQSVFSYITHCACTCGLT